MDFEIRHGRGIGPLRFGDGQERVRELLGDASSLEVIEGECVVWSYDTLGIELEFGDDADGRLVNVDTDALEASVCGVRPFGLSEAEADAVFEGTARLEADPELGDGERSARRVVPLRDAETPAAPGGEVLLWFGSGTCDAISAAAAIDEDGFYVWPAAD